MLVDRDSFSPKTMLIRREKLQSESVSVRLSNEELTLAATKAGDDCCKLPL